MRINRLSNFHAPYFGRKIDVNEGKGFGFCFFPLDQEYWFPAELDSRVRFIQAPNPVAFRNDVEVTNYQLITRNRAKNSIQDILLQ